MADPGLDPVPVTFVAGHGGVGGSELYLETLLSSLGSGWIDEVICLEHGPFVERLRGHGLDAEVIPTPARLGILPAALELRRALMRRAARVVHANGVKAALLCGLATLGTPKRVIWVKHDFSWDGPLTRAVALGSKQVVTVSPALTAGLGSRLGRRVHVVPAGIVVPAADPEEGRARLVELLGCSADDPIVTLVGRLQESKGQLELLEAAPRILARRPETRFCLVGGRHPHQPDHADVVTRRRRELGLERSVILAGQRSDAAALISGSDVLVVPSIPDSRGRAREGSPLVAIEALAVGTPVVGYAHGGIPDAVGEAGRLVTSGDRDELGDAILEVIESEDAREAMATRGRERAATRNSVAAMTTAMKRRYREAAAA